MSIQNFNFRYTVNIFSGEPGESAQLRFALKNSGRFLRFGRISSIVQPKNLLIWKFFAQIERNSPEIFGAKLNCADSPISGEKNNYCVAFIQTDFDKFFPFFQDFLQKISKFPNSENRSQSVFSKAS
jgi:hypothetical protein